MLLSRLTHIQYSDFGYQVSLDDDGFRFLNRCIFLRVFIISLSKTNLQAMAAANITTDSKSSVL